MIKQILSFLAVTAMFAAINVHAAEQKKPTPDKKYSAGSCCDKAQKEGKACAHKCCVDAEKEGTVCGKCNK